MCRWIVLVTVGEHQSDVSSKFPCICIVSLVHLFLRERHFMSARVILNCQVKKSDVWAWSQPSHPDGTQVHGLLNDGVIVVQAQSNCIHRGIEGPCIRLVPLWEHFLQDVTAAPELLRKSDLLVLDRQVFLWRFDGSSTASPGEKCTWCRLVLLLTSGNGGGGGSVVCSPLETFFNLNI